MINEKNKSILKTNENSINLATQSDCEIRIEKLNNKLQRTSNELEEISSLYAKSVRDSLEKSRKIKKLEDETEELAERLKASENNKELEKQLEDSEKTKKELEKQLEDSENNKELEKQLEDRENNKQELEKQLQDTEVIKQELEKQLQDTEVIKQELEKQLQDYENIKQELEKQLQDAKEEQEKLAERLKESENNKDLEKQLEDSENTKKELEKQLEDRENNKKELEKQLQDMEATQGELAKQLKDCQDKSRSNDDDDDLVITSDDKVAKFIMEVLDKAIPYSARIVNCVSNGKFIINKDAEISNTIPSTLLLRQKEKATLLLKIMQEVLMTNFWNGNNKLYGLYSAWAMNTLDYGPKGNYGVNKRLFPKTTIKNHGDDSIIWTRMLFNSKNQLYFDEVFNIIEKYLQKHGVNCNVEKAFNPSHGRICDSQKVLVSHGSLPFPKVKINGVSSDSLYYYLQVSFNIKMKLNNKSYPIRGYTMLLSDALDLYKIKGGDVIEPDDENKTIIDEFI